MPTALQKAYQRQQAAFHAWLNKQTPAEKSLRLDAIRFEDRHFSDLCLQSKRVSRRLSRHEVELDGEWHSVEDDLIGPSISEWIFRVRPLKDCIGLCESKKRRISVEHSLGGDVLKATLLHEMIHAYEDQLTHAVREWLTLDLYNRLTRALGRRAVDRYIDTSTHVMFFEHSHGVLFLLKSLEIDRRFRWPLGTVFGYGRTEYLGCDC